MAAIEPRYEDDELTSSAWMDHGACKGRTQLFFAPKAERPQARARREAQARRLCATCPVLVPCQRYARVNREYGLWGGGPGCRSVRVRLRPGGAAGPLVRRRHWPGRRWARPR